MSPVADLQIRLMDTGASFEELTELLHRAAASCSFLEVA
jgi:hypothetical protein